MAWFQSDPSNAKEIGAIAHGPALLARVEGVTVGLRSIVAYSADLETTRSASTRRRSVSTTAESSAT